MKDTYRTIDQPTDACLFKEKGSKFYGYAFPVSNQEEVKLFLEKLRKLHSSAGHFCYAWQLGTDDIRYRVNDDGEPKNSAGMPIHGQLQAFDLTNVLVVSVRYFGGTKLGVGGLIQAYKNSAQLALNEAVIVERTIDVLYQLNFDYSLMNVVMRTIKAHNIIIISQDLSEECTYFIAVRKKNAEIVVQIFERLYKLKIQKMLNHKKQKSS